MGAPIPRYRVIADRSCALVELDTQVRLVVRTEEELHRAIGIITRAVETSARSGIVSRLWSAHQHHLRLVADHALAAHIPDVT